MRCSLEGLNKEVENLVSSFNDMKNRVRRDTLKFVYTFVVVLSVWWLFVW